MAANDGTRRTSLYVGDLHPDVTEKDLTETFAQVGPLLSVHTCRDMFSGRSLRYGYVNYWLPCHAFTALKSLNHTILRGKSIRIMWCERDPTARKNGIGNLFVKNLDKSITSARLETVFSKYGTVLSCKVVEENGNSKGFGFVQFDSEDSAMAARGALHDTELEGKKFYTSINLHGLGSKNLTDGRTLKKAEYNYANQLMESKASKLFVTNLDPSVDDKKLEELFCTYGKVISANVIRTAGVSRRFGFVRFSSPDEAKKALKSLKGADFEGKTLYVAVAWPKEQPSMLYKPYNNFPHQLLYASNWQQQLCNFPPSISPIHCRQLGPWQPTMYQHSISSFNSYNLSQTQNFQGTFYELPMQHATWNAYWQGRFLEMPKDQKLPCKLQGKLCIGSSPEIGDIRHGYMHYPWFQKLQTPSTLNGYWQERYLQMWKGQNPSSKLKEITNGDGKELSKGSGTVKAIGTVSSAKMDKTKLSHILSSLVQNHQPRHDSRRLLRSPQVKVQNEKAVQPLKGKKECSDL